MLAVVYRWRLKPETDVEFRAAWRQMTEAIHDKHGSLGSRLHRADDGTWVAYAQWPSRSVLDAARHQASSADPDAGRRMKACIEERFPELLLEVTDDLLKPLM